MQDFTTQIRDLTRLINRELRSGRCEKFGGRKTRACNVPGTREAGKIAMWQQALSDARLAQAIASKGGRA